MLNLNNHKGFFIKDEWKEFSIFAKFLGGIANGFVLYLKNTEQKNYKIKKKRGERV